MRITRTDGETEATATTAAALRLEAGEFRRLLWLYRTEDPIMVGRGEECHIVIRDPEVDDVHCTLIPEGQAWIIHDLNSQRGIRVNGKRLTRHTLKSGDRLQIGKLTFSYEEPPSQPEHTPLAPVATPWDPVTTLPPVFVQLIAGNVGALSPAREQDVMAGDAQRRVLPMSQEKEERGGDDLGSRHGRTQSGGSRGPIRETAVGAGEDDRDAHERAIDRLRRLNEELDRLTVAAPVTGSGRSARGAASSDRSAPSDAERTLDTLLDRLTEIADARVAESRSHRVGGQDSYPGPRSSARPINAAAEAERELLESERAWRDHRAGRPSAPRSEAASAAPRSSVHPFDRDTTHPGLVDDDYAAGNTIATREMQHRWKTLFAELEQERVELAKQRSEFARREAWLAEMAAIIDQQCRALVAAHERLLGQQEQMSARATEDREQLERLRDHIQNLSRALSGDDKPSRRRAA